MQPKSQTHKEYNQKSKVVQTFLAANKPNIPFKNPILERILLKKKKKSVNGLGFFSVNGLGYNFCGIFEEKANYRSDFGKKEGKQQWS